MIKLVALFWLAVGTLTSGGAFAAERTVVLAIENMDCADCPYIVKKSLEAVPGVVKASVSYAARTATVTYDDAKADVTFLTAATTRAGYPSTPKS